MTKGYVYILSNPAMPDILKIGKTSRPVEHRCSELYQTGVPQEFKIEAYELVPDCDEVERWMHDAFTKQRISAGREFFKVSLDQAERQLKQCQREQIGQWVEEFDESLVLVNDYEFVEPSIIHLLADYFEVAPPDISLAFHELGPEEFRPSLERHWKRIESRKKDKRSTLLTAVNGGAE